MHARLMMVVPQTTTPASTNIVDWTVLPIPVPTYSVGYTLIENDPVYGTYGYISGSGRYHWAGTNLFEFQFDLEANTTYTAYDRCHRFGSSYHTYVRGYIYRPDGTQITYGTSSNSSLLNWDWAPIKTFTTTTAGMHRFRMWNLSNGYVNFPYRVNGMKIE